MIVAWLEAGCPLRKTAASETAGAPRSPATPGADTPPAIIREFRGRYAFLSNFSPSRHVVRGYTVPTLEHAYQMEKGIPGSLFGFEPCGDCSGVPISWDRKIASAPTAAAAKRLGRLIPLRPDWKKIRVPVMARLTDEKYTDRTLALLLLATDDAVLQEGNRWGDRFWGVDLVTGVGENHLGQLLMLKRRALREATQKGTTR